MEVGGWMGGRGGREGGSLTSLSLVMVALICSEPGVTVKEDLRWENESKTPPNPKKESRRLTLPSVHVEVLVEQCWQSDSCPHRNCWYSYQSTLAINNDT